MQQASSHQTQTALTSDSTEIPIFGREFLLIMAIQSMFGVSFSSFLILPKFLKLELGANAETIGWMSAAALGSAALFAPLIGYAVTRLDRRLVLAAAVIIEAAAAFSFLAVDHVGVLSMLLRAGQGLAFVAVFTVNAALVADTIPNHKLSRALGYLGASTLVTNALAPLFAEPVSQHFGWSYVFICAGTMCLLTLVLIVQLNPDTSKATYTPAARRSFRPVFLTLPVQFGSLLMGAGLGVMFTYVQPFALERGAKEIGSLFLGYAIAATLVRIFLGGVSDHIGAARTAAAAMMLYAITVFSTAFLTPPTILFLGVGLGISHGFLYPALSTAGLCTLERHDRGRFLGWFSFCFNIGFALTVLVLGPIADRYGYAPIFIATGFCLSLGVMPLARFERRALIALAPKV